MRALVVIMLLFAPLAALAQDNATRDDRGFIQGLLEDALSAPGRSVRLNGFEGALSSEATVDSITVTDPEGVWLRASGVTLSWNRAALLRGRIEIREITIETIELPRPPVPEETALPAPEARGAFALPELPVSVNIAALRIGQAEIGAPVLGEAARFSVEGAAQLAAGAGQADIDISRLDRSGTFRFTGGYDNATRNLALDLALSEPAGGLAATLLGIPGSPAVQLLVSGDDPIDDFAATVRLATDGQDRLTGTVALASADDGSARFEVDLSGDVAPVLAPQFVEFFGEDLRLRTAGERRPDGGVSLSELRVNTAALNILGEAMIAPDGWPETFALEARIAPPDGTRVTLPLPGEVSTVAGARLVARFDAARGSGWEIEGRLDGFERQGLRLRSADMTGAGEIRRDSGRITGRVDIGLDGLQPSDADLARALGEQLSGKLRFDWTEGAPLRLQDISLAGADFGVEGELSVRGLAGGGEIAVEPDIVLEARNLDRFAGMAGIDLAGAASLRIEGSAEPLTGVLALGFNGQTRDLGTGIAQLDALLVGQGMLDLRIERDMAGLRVAPLAVETRQARIDARADLRSASSTLSASAALKDLAPILPGIAGPGSLDLTAQQDPAGWQLEMETALPGETRATFDGLVALADDRLPEISGNLTARTGRLAVFSDLAGRSLSGAASLIAAGSITPETLTFDIDAEGEAQGLDIGLPTITPLLQGTTRFALSASRIDETGEVDLRRLRVTSPALEATADGRLGAETGHITYALDLRNLGLVVPDIPGPARLSGRAERRGDSLFIEANGRGPGGILLDASADVAGDASRVSGRVTGQVPLALANRQLDGRAVSGLARLDLSVNGRPGLDALSGRISVDGARFADPALNLALTDITGQADLAGGRAVLGLEARVATGGRISVSGPVSLTAPFDAGLAVALNDVTLRDASLYEADLSGGLTLDGPLLGGARIAGAIDVAAVELRLAQLGPSYSALEGLRHLNPPASVRRTLRYAGLDQPTESDPAGVGFPLDVVIRAPARIFVRGRGVDAELGGTLRLTGTTANIVPVGGFDLIRGRIDVLTRRLVLTEGSARLRGSFDPSISFTATSQVDGVAVSLQLEGLASAPELSVTSVPELPQEEALSFLLFGREVERISAFQALRLAAALRTLSGRGGGGITGSLRNSLGVDDLDFSTDADGTSQARVGAYISENIYSDLTVRSDGTSQINLNLEVSPRLRLRGRLGSDGESALGVFFERDY